MGGMRVHVAGWGLRLGVDKRLAAAGQSGAGPLPVKRLSHHCRDSSTDPQWELKHAQWRDGWTLDPRRGDKTWKVQMGRRYTMSAPHSSVILDASNVALL